MAGGGLSMALFTGWLAHNDRVLAQFGAGALFAVVGVFLVLMGKLTK